MPAKGEAKEIQEKSLDLLGFPCPNRDFSKA
jgi:hypothetical protein